MGQTINFQRPNISIIVPVYNVEKYLIRCLDSISNQEFSGTFEIIAAEACSTDGSLALLKAYQSNEPRLKIIEHAKREQLSTSRVAGMEASTGDYIMHVDSDDWLLPNALERLYEICKATNADVVVFDYVMENNKGQRFSPNKIKKKLITTDKLKVQHHFFGAVWKKIVKRDLIENMIYSKIGLTVTEDLIYSTEILLRANKICVIPESYYTYFVNTASLTRQIKSEQYLQNQLIILRLLQYLITRHNPNTQFVNKLLNYFEKWIYLEFAKIHFWNKEKLVNCAKLVREFFQFPIVPKSHISSLESSISNRFVCLFEVYKHFGLKNLLEIIKHS